MALAFDRLIDRLLFRRALPRWRRLAESAQSADLIMLRSLRTPARQLRREIDRLLHVADSRLTLPMLGSNAISKPLMTDWAWRPEIWRGPIAPIGIAAVANRTMFGTGATVFHDCDRSELAIRQIRNTREADLAPFGFRMDVFGFEGGFLSLVLDLPEDVIRGLTLRHIIRMETTVETEKPLEMFARLNIKHGPNTEQLVRELPLGSSDVAAEFDLAYTKMNEKRIERAWVDLIFERPEMNQITLRDVTFTRRPRSEI